MKKQYIRPESRLFVINLEENIASSSSIVSGGISGMGLIKFTHAGLGECRGFYTGDIAVGEGVGNDFFSYYFDLVTKTLSQTHPTYLKCFTPNG